MRVKNILESFARDQEKVAKMPEYLALRCFSCGTFQSHQLRKDNKFSCVMCGEKQSYRKIYARSFKANDIRPIVQQFNMKRAEIDEQELEEKKRQQERVAEHQQRAQDEESEPEDDWNQFIEKDEPVADTAGCEIATEQLKGFKMVGRPQEKWEKVDNTPPARGRGRGRGKRQLKEDDDDVQPLGEADYQPAPKRGRGGWKGGNTGSRGGISSTTPSAFRPSALSMVRVQQPNTKPTFVAQFQPQPTMLSQAAPTSIAAQTQSVSSSLSQKLAEYKNLQAQQKQQQQQQQKLWRQKQSEKKQQQTKLAEPTEWDVYLQDDEKQTNEDEDNTTATNATNTKTTSVRMAAAGGEYESEYGEEYNEEYGEEYGEYNEYGEEEEELAFGDSDNFVAVGDDDVW